MFISSVDEDIEHTKLLDGQTYKKSGGRLYHPPKGE